MKRALLLTLGATFVAAPVAEAVISPGQSIRGVRIGDSEADVKKKLGKGLKSRPAAPKAKSYSHARLKLDLQFVRASDGKYRVTIISALPGSKERTTKGIGLGATIKEVRRAYPKAKGCPKSGEGLCSLAAGAGRYTTFLFDGEGAVYSITVSKGKVAGG